MPIPRAHVFASLLFALLTLAGCRAPDLEPEKPEWVFGLLVTGPGGAGKTDAERQTIMSGHMANIGRLAQERKLVVAGPFGAERPDASWRGVFVLATGDTVVAREWGQTDPAVQTGVMSLELAPLATSAPLMRALDLHEAEMAEAQRTGRKPELADQMRTYVLLFAHDAAAAKEALTDARAERRIVFEGRLVGSQRGEWLAVLDAADVGAAEQLLGPARERIGRHELASWWSAKNLARIHE